MTTQARARARRIVAEVFDVPADAPPAATTPPTDAQLAGARIVAEILAESTTAPPSEDAASPRVDEPEGADLAARMVAEVLGRPSAEGPPLPPPNPKERVGSPEPGPPPPPAAAATQRLEEEPPPRTGRWVLVTLAAAIALAVLFPLAIRAVLQLLGLS
ncbi:MAG: hypothetical protein WD638_10245 [Nitriliruptoraceae bacterium]